jgi:hypothetical protein
MKNTSRQSIQSVRQYSYILRLWRVTGSEAVNWRASLEIPDTGKRIGFASLEQLFAYLIDFSESDSNLQIMKEKKRKGHQ